MTSTTRFIIGSALLLGGARLAIVLVRGMTPRHAQVMPVDPEAVSQRAANEAELRAMLAAVQDASVIELEERGKVRQAKADAKRTLRDLGREARSVGAPALGQAALALEDSLERETRRTCSVGGSAKRFEAMAEALDPAARAALGERLEITLRHVRLTCELTLLAPPSTR